MINIIKNEFRRYWPIMIVCLVIINIFLPISFFSYDPQFVIIFYYLIIFSMSILYSIEQFKNRNKLYSNSDTNKGKILLSKLIFVLLAILLFLIIILIISTIYYKLVIGNLAYSYMFSTVYMLTIDKHGIFDALEIWQVLCISFVIFLFIHCSFYLIYYTAKLKFKKNIIVKKILAISGMVLLIIFEISTYWIVCRELNFRTRLFDFNHFNIVYQISYINYYLNFFNIIIVILTGLICIGIFKIIAKIMEVEKV